MKRAAGRARTLLRFGRPHTLIGTTVSLVGLSLVASAEPGHSFSILRLLGALFSALAVNVFIVGLNQITDVPIDRVNKPFLPLASGEMGRNLAVSVTGISLAAAMFSAAVQGPYLLAAVVLGALVGTVYSLEPLRLKRSPLWAAACIASVRGVVVNLLVFLHFSGAPLALPTIPPRIWALTCVVLGISLVIAWYKDIPDIRGDREFGVWTLSVRMGARRVVWIGGGLLTACYLLVSAAGFLGLPGVNPVILAVSHLGLLAALWLAIRGVNLADPASVRGFYLFVWGLFFAEYLAFPAACLLT